MSFRRTKDGLIFTIKKCTDVEYLKNSLITRATGLKESAFEIVNECLSVKLDQETLLKNWALLKELVSENVKTLCEKPGQLVAAIRTDSRNLYEKVVRNYRVQKILSTRPKVQPLPEAAH